MHTRDSYLCNIFKKCRLLPQEVSGLVPFGHFREAVRRFATILDEDVGSVKQVSVDVLSNDDFIAIENFFNRRVEIGKADDDTMNGGDV